MCRAHSLRFTQSRLTLFTPWYVRRALESLQGQLEGALELLALPIALLPGEHPTLPGQSRPVSPLDLLTELSSERPTHAGQSLGSSGRYGQHVATSAAMSLVRAGCQGNSELLCQQVMLNFLGAPKSLSLSYLVALKLCLPGVAR